MSGEHSYQTELKLDALFNQHVFRTLSYSVTGFVVGLGASLFFKHKVPILFFSAGIGAGQGVFEFQRELQQYRLVRKQALIKPAIQLPVQHIAQPIVPPPVQAAEPIVQPVVLQVQPVVQVQSEPVQTQPKQE